MPLPLVSATQPPNPHGVGVFTSFLYRAGIVKHDPSKWNDLFFEEANSLQGN